MMQEDLVRRVHASPSCGVLAVTGGGSAAIGRLLTESGGSRTVLEAIVPYSEASLADWLGEKPGRACDEGTSRRIALRALRRAEELSPGADPSTRFGLGATASLATDRPKLGEHRAHVAVQTTTRTAVLTLRFDKQNSTRADEERAVTHAVVALLADAAGVQTIDLTRTPPGIEAQLDSAVAPTAWAELVAGRRALVAINAPSPEASVCVLPGSFNPPHQGHAALADIARRLTGRPVVLELSVENVDKPALDWIDLRRRLDGLADRGVWLTRAATFLEKARVAPGAVFAVGADTIERIGQGRYYESRAARDAAIYEIASLGCRFLVFGRRDGERFVTLEGLDLPTTLRALCEGVPESTFRLDISSTEIRTAP